MIPHPFSGGFPIAPQIKKAPPIREGLKSALYKCIQRSVVYEEVRIWDSGQSRCRLPKSDKSALDRAASGCSVTLPPPAQGDLLKISLR